MSDYRDLEKEGQNIEIKEALQNDAIDTAETSEVSGVAEDVLTEQERLEDEAMLAEIRGAAVHAEVPGRLRPENIGALLEGIELENVAAGKSADDQAEKAQKEAGFTQDLTGSEAGSDGGDGSGDGGRIVRFPHRRRIIGGVAAACAAAYLISPIGVRMLGNGMLGGRGGQSSGESVAEYVPSATSEGAPDSETFLDSIAKDQEVSDFLTRAKSYEDVYDKLTDLRREIEERRVSSNTKDDGFWIADADGTGPAEAAAEESSAAPMEGEPKAAGDFSETNLREADVDEGDIVKTDGSYIYSYSEADGEGVRIVAIDGGAMDVVSEIPAPDSGFVIDMYISGDRLVMIQTGYDGSLEQSDEEIYYYDRQSQLYITTYDISDRSHPAKLGEVTTGGSYHTSRISGGYLYLVTQYHRNYWLYDYAVVKNTEADAKTDAQDEAYDEDTFTASGDLPKINGETIPARSIYLPDKLQQEQTLTLISIDLEHPDKAADTKTFYAWASDIYMTSDAIFLEAPDWNSEYEVTNIIRIEYSDGIFHPTAAGTVPGSINDAFAVDEDSNGNLRIATTIWLNSGQTNGVYIYDKYMHQIGRLTGLAKGEMIQSARFLDDICYLVTYRNMDPLFSIDVSDPKNPKLLGELEITGFSDYLHFWSQTELLGLGLETDPKDGEIEGVKLTMFDITDPADVTAITSELMEGMESADAMYNYKALLINPAKNIIGFRTEGYEEIVGEDDEDWDWIYRQSYQIYSYEDGTFTNLKTITEEEEEWMDYNTRGIYVGSTFYLVGQNQIVAYDMENGFAEIGRLN